MRTQCVLLGLAASLCAAMAADSAATNERAMSLDDCIKSALERNLDVQYERLNPEIGRYAVSMAYAGYDPVFTTGGKHTFDTSPGQVQSGTGLNLPSTTTDGNTYNAGIGGTLPTGLQYGVSSYVRETYGARAGVPFESTSGGATLTLTQPLLKNMWIDDTRKNVWVARKTLKSSELVLDYRIMSVVYQVEQAYYELVAAQEAIIVQEKALELAKQQLAENKKRVEVGAMAQLDEKQAESQVATAQADLITAQQARALRQNALKKLVDGNFSSWATQTLTTTEKLEVIPQAFSLQDSWHKSMTLRPDLQQARVDLEKQDIIIRYNRNQLFPELDLVGGYGHNGANAIMRDFGGVLGQLEEGSSPSYSYGATLSVPLTQRAARNSFKTSKAQKQQMLIQLKKQEQEILVAVDDAVKTAQSALQRVEATKAARVYAEAALDAEQKKLTSGKSTSFVVLDLQTKLTSARFQEIRAQADYIKALSTLAMAEGSTLERRQIDVKVK